MSPDKLSAMERATAARYPRLFSDDPHYAHQAASPQTVELARAEALANVREIVGYYLQALAEDGWKLVPREATEEMLFKGEEAMAAKDVDLIMRRKDGKASATETVLDTLYAGDVWDAMIAATPDALDTKP